MDADTGQGKISSIYRYKCIFDCIALYIYTLKQNLCQKATAHVTCNNGSIKMKFY